MSNVPKLKKKAAEFELKKQFDKALAVYIELLADFDENATDLDVALFNRVGDLLMRQGNVADAVDYYERAVDRYADGGFFNNAIALCNKILRHSPGRSSVYYKLGKISAQKGFKSDAKQNFLEYADRMQKSGKMDEAFRALKEFADLCPDQDDIRLMLADQLSKLNRKDEAIEQLQLLYARYEDEGRVTEAHAAAERMKAIDPSVSPQASAAVRRKTTKDLIFLDLSDDAPRSRPTESVATIPAPEPPVIERVETVEGIAAAADSASDQLMVTDSPLSGITRAVDEPLPEAEPESGLRDEAPTISGLELSNAGESATDESAGSLLDFQPTSFEISSPPVDEQEETGFAGGGDLELILPDDDVDMTPPRSSGEILAELDPPMLRTESTEVPFIVEAEGISLLDVEAESAPGLDMEAESGAQVDARQHDIPLLDLDLPIPGPGVSRGEAAPRVSASIPDLTLDDALVSGLDEEAAVPEGLVGSGGMELTSPEPAAEAPAPSARLSTRRSTMVAAQSVEILRAAVEGEPEAWSLRRELAEAMLDSGNREAGIHELETAMAGAERSNDLDLASAIAEEVARIDPGSIKHLQKRVEYAFRTNDKPRLIEAYMALGDAMLREQQTDKARAVYQRVLDLAPDDIRAQAALETLPQEEAPPPPPVRRTTGVKPRSPAKSQPAVVPSRSPDDGFVNLGDWLREDDAPQDTRMVVEEQEPSGDEEADFNDMLKKFKQGIAQNVDQEDYQSHYDLGIAFKEMGLLDEAVAEFQKALRGPANRVPTYEALGHCFMEKEQYAMASTILSRGLQEKGITEDQLVGVLYLLGRAAEALNRRDDALSYYHRVFLIDIQFRDVAERITDVERAAR